MANESLGKAKTRKNDEFYTVFDYIQKEMNAYLEYNPDVFRGKTVLLPCDDPEWSNFTKYFAQNFETLGLKKLISTGYAADCKEQQYEQYHQMTLFELQSPQYDAQKSRAHGRIFTLERDANKSGIDVYKRQLMYNAWPIWQCWTVFFIVCLVSMGVMLGMVKWLERVTTVSYTHLGQR